MIDEEKKELKRKEDAIRETLLKEMEDKGIIKYQMKISVLLIKHQLRKKHLEQKILKKIYLIYMILM